MNTPNKLTVARMIMVPFLVVFLLTGWGGEANRYIALVIFAAASITDWFDGYLARKNNLVTNFGKFMDPLADKLLVCSAMICMIELGRLSHAAVDSAHKILSDRRSGQCPLRSGLRHKLPPGSR